MAQVTPSKTVIGLSAGSSFLNLLFALISPVCRGTRGCSLVVWWSHLQGFIGMAYEQPPALALSAVHTGTACESARR